MKQAQKSGQHIVHHRQHRFLARLVFAKDLRLGRFDEPIAIVAPEEIVQALRYLVELVFAIRGFGRRQQLVKTSQ